MFLIVMFFTMIMTVWDILFVSRSPSFLGRLPKVDLIILEGGKCPSVRPSVRPQKVSSISMKFGI